MENATKALLIAAAVLIAIVLIALGVRLLSSSGDAASQASNVSNQINTAADGAVLDVTDAFEKLNPSTEEPGE